MLDAFQSAAQQVADEEIGALIPLYRFYPSIESFLDTSVKRTIDQAKDNASLKPFDIDILRMLFLIRYVDEMTGNVENLVTLSIDQIDADRIFVGVEGEQVAAHAPVFKIVNADRVWVTANVSEFDLGSLPALAKMLPQLSV